MQKWNSKLMVATAFIVGSLGLTACTTTSGKPDTVATNVSKAAAIDASVDATLTRLYSTVKGSRELVSKSRGVLVFPEVIQAGFIVGGQSGNGALRVGNHSVGYYNTSSLSVGLQAGAQSKAVVFLFMTQNALDEFRGSEGWAAGAASSVALVKMGANGAIDTTTAAAPVQVVVMTNAGLMGDVSINGTKVTKLQL